MSDDLEELLANDEITEEELILILRKRRRLREKGIVRRGEGGALAATGNIVNGLAFPSSANAAPVAPRGLERREWEQSESNTPGGAYTPGGSTAGGIFGDGPIPFDNYDPASMGRAAPAIQAQVSLKTLEVLQRLEEQAAERDREVRELKERERQRERLEDPPPRRRLRGGQKWGE